jgi:hypothetical protein
VKSDSEGHGSSTTTLGETSVDKLFSAEPEMSTSTRRAAATLQSLLPPIGILGLNSKVFCRCWEARPRLGLAPSRRCPRAGRIRKAHLQVALMETSPLDVSLMFAVACAIFGAFCEMAAPQLCSMSALSKGCSYDTAEVAARVSTGSALP